MANTKEYKIVINGISESVSAVDALNKELDALEKRIKTLEGKNVKVGASSSGSKASTSSMNEEEKLAKQIAQIDEKRKAYSKEIYQNYLAAKDVLDATVKDQQQIAASERLQANNYTNTMAGMKQELSDLKKVMQTTDLGDEKFGEMSQRARELTQKLKELEEAYGQFGRNVGNYQSAFDGISKVSVNIGGAVKEFDSLKQATKAIRDEMGKLEYNGQQDTKMYRQLENELGKVSKAQLRLNSAMKDAKSSSKAMDDLLDTMESFTALGQVGQGFSTLFGFDNTELEQQIAKLVALQNVLQGIEKIRQQMNTKEGIGKWLGMGSDAVDKFVMKITGAQKRMGMLVMETRTATMAVQGLSTALKALGGVAIAGGLMIAMEALSALIEDFKKWQDGGYKAGTASDVLSKKIDALNERYNQLRQNNLSDYFQGIINNEQFAARETEILSNQLKDLNGQYSQLVGTISHTPIEIVMKMKDGEEYEDTVKRLKDRFNELARELDNYENSTSSFKKFAAEWFSGPIANINKTKREFQELGIAIAQDFIGKMDAAQQKASQEIEKWGHVTQDTKQEIMELAAILRKGDTTYALFENIDKFTKEGQTTINTINAMKDGFLALNESLNSGNDGREVANRAKRIEQLKIDAMKDGLAKQRAQTELNRKQELAEADHDGELKKAINAKYDREILEAEKTHGREMAAAYADLQSLRIEIMEEGWAKEKKRLEHERDEKIRAVVESEKLVGARKAAINELYNKKIKEAEKQFAAERLKIYEDLANDIQSVNKETFSTEVETALQNTENQYQEKLRNIGNMITQYNYKNFESMKKYYSDVLKATQEQASQEEAIKQKSLDKQYEYDKQEEEQRHDRLVRENGEYAEQLKQGKITKEQYDELIEKENEAHLARMNSLEKKYNSDTVANTQETLDKKERAYSDYYTNVIAQIRKGQDEIVKKMGKAIVTDTDKKGAGYGFNIVDYKQTKENYAKLINEEQTAIAKIQAERKKLYDDREAKRITGEYFTNRLEELDAAEEAALETLKDLQTKSKEAFPQFLSSIYVYVEAIANAVSSVMNSMFEIINNSLDKEQEALDDEYDKLQDELDKRRDAIKDYSNEINSIEDELATARGSRRQHLIDQLNAEMELQRESIKEKQRLEKEEQKNKEQMQKKQDALDKKRRKAQWYQDLAQAMVNGAMAVTYAAMNTWPVPAIPMMALAASTTTAQLAVIAANHPFEKGGQLDGGVAQGPRHRDGGIPVLGGRASIEGGEFITNRQTTAKNVDLLDYINSKHRKLNIDDFIDFYSSGKAKKSFMSSNPKTKFADGGTIPMLNNDYNFDDRLLSAFEDYSNRPVYVSVVDINRRQAAVKNVQVLAGLGE